MEYFSSFSFYPYNSVASFSRWRYAVSLILSRFVHAPGDNNLENFLIVLQFHYRKARYLMCTSHSVTRIYSTSCSTYVCACVIHAYNTSASACMDVVYAQGNPFIGAKRKRVPAVIRQTGCIIDRGIEFSLSVPVLPTLRALQHSLSLSLPFPLPLLCSPSPPPPPPSYVPLSQLDMNATRLLLMHPSICILQTGCIKSRPSARYFAVKRVIYYSIWWRRVLGRQSAPGSRSQGRRQAALPKGKALIPVCTRATSKWTS